MCLNLEDILQLISDQDLIEMEKILKEKLPVTLRPYLYLFNHNKWRKQLKNDESGEFKGKLVSDKCVATFYGHKSGLIKNCTFMAITKEKDYTVFAYTLEENGYELRECFAKTNRINWKLGPLIVSMEDQHLKIFRELYCHRKAIFDIANNIYCLPKEKATQFQIDVPSEVVLKPLTGNDAKLMDDEWPHQYPGSYDFIKTLVEVNGGLGLYSRENNQLLSWVAINDNFCPGFLQTVKSAKRRGYGELLIKALSKQIADVHGVDTLAFVVKTNNPSNSLFNKLGFEVINGCAWMLLEQDSKL